MLTEPASMIVLRSTMGLRGSRLPHRRGGRARPARGQDVYKLHTLAQPVQCDHLRRHTSCTRTPNVEVSWRIRCDNLATAGRGAKTVKVLAGRFFFMNRGVRVTSKAPCANKRSATHS